MSSELLHQAVLEAWSTDEVRAAVAGSVVLLDQSFLELAQPFGCSSLMEMGAWAVLSLEEAARDGLGLGTDLKPIRQPSSLVFFTGALEEFQLYAKVLEHCDCELRASFFYAHQPEEEIQTLVQLLTDATTSPTLVRVHRFGLNFTIGLGPSFVVPGCAHCFPEDIQSGSSTCDVDRVASGIASVLTALGCAAPKLLSAGGLSWKVAEALEGEMFSTASSTRSASVIIVDRLLDVHSGVAHTETLAETVNLLSEEVLNQTGLLPQLGDGSLCMRKHRESLVVIKKRLLELIEVRMLKHAHHSNSIF